ncbi:MAG: nucleoside-diphosphate kinase [Nitrososphaerota archaeon]|nr:nucleoside-diphosphate kinase [Aigarchaeota archaeon]MDW8077108.1 nucleoside-diphosphate kinase [Nitrososphaerota archaeon]
MSVERSFIILKPSCLKRGLVGEIISRFEKKGLKIIQIKIAKLPKEKVEELYRQHLGKSFYNELIECMVSDRVVLMVVEGRNAIGVVRRMIGATDPAEASPGTIRGDLALDKTDNLIHACDSPESYEREVRIFFNEKELA